MLEKLKTRVLKANLDVVKAGLVVLTWGNVSARDLNTNYVVIKPSGVSYDLLREEDMVVVDMDGHVIEGDLKPSSDLLTHLELYKKHPTLGGIVHTHSTHAVAFAQAGRFIPAYGTTHADYFNRDIPCTRSLTDDEIKNEYELNTGRVINETIKGDVLSTPGIVVKNHGPFVWGDSPEKAVYHAIVLEEVAKMAILTEQINSEVKPVDQVLLNKHYDRKHGKHAYYGQKGDKTDE